MTLIKRMGLRIDYPPPERQTNPNFDISIGLRTHNDINQGNGVRNRLTPRKTLNKSTLGYLLRIEDT